MKCLKIKIYLLLFIIITSCIESIDVITNVYESVLVVEATITNEFKNQEVKLSRTFQINETNTFKNEINATVVVVDNNQKSYFFKETLPGTYVSTHPFTPEKGKLYTLQIITADGRKYSSTNEKLTSITNIQNLVPRLETNGINVSGLSIYVESFNPDNDANYYRYQFEETYKIKVPFWSYEELKIISEDAYVVEVVSKNYDNEFCYQTSYSNDILQTETASLDEDRVNFPVRFIPDTDFIISKRYSILVKQYVQNFSAYNYYKTLKKLSTSETVFTQNQPGFITGNVFSESNSNEKVIGFFEVSSVSEKRIFFNHRDVFTTPIPKFIETCDFVAPLLYDPFTRSSPLIDLLKKGTHVYYDENDLGLDYLEGNYLLVPKICGDCREIGTNVKPIFWID